MVSCKNLGAFCGMLGFAYLLSGLGDVQHSSSRFWGRVVSTVMFFKMFNSMDNVWMSFVMGFFQLALFAGFAIYLPELFPRACAVPERAFVTTWVDSSQPPVRSLWASFKSGCQLVLWQRIPETDTVARAAARLGAFREACVWMSLIFVVGIVVVFFIHETKG